MKKTLGLGLGSVALIFCQAAIGADLPERKWEIVLGHQLESDEAVKVAIQDIQSAGTQCQLEFEVKGDRFEPGRNCILVGAPDRNEQTAKLAGDLHLTPVGNPQGFEIVTRNVAGHKVIVVAGGSIVGDVYGLYWIWDQIRIHRGLPDIQIRRAPVLENRISLAWGRQGSDGASQQEMRNALRYGLNWVSGPAILDLVPWSSEPERTRNEENRKRAGELIRYAHALHLKYFSFANEFTYHPSLLQEFDAQLSPCDPRFWEAVRAKFKRLFETMPELDGVELCNDDISGFWDNYRAFDVMHDTPECEWPLDKRFRTFVETVQQVVANEFHKTYFHFTWSLVSHEQHNQPDVFRKIFSPEVPVTNLFLIPKITAADRWWFQPFNPTFNLTPHPTVVGFETMNYYESSEAHLFPTFAGPYYQAGLQLLLRKPGHNLRGSGYRAGPDPSGWDTESLTAYTLSRLSWDPNEDIDQILRDFCAIHFGPEASEGMARVYLLSAPAYKYGLHIEPVAYGQFNSLLQIRVGTFPVEGFPELDGGKEHIDFLESIYLRCKPWEEETFAYLDHGLAKAQQMEELYSEVRPKFGDANLAHKVGNAVRMTRLLIQVNNLYVKTAFAYFEYRDKPLPEKRTALRERYGRLLAVRSDFMHAPGYGYQLFGVDQLAANVNEMLEDREEAETKLAQGTSRAEVTKIILRAQENYREILRLHAEDAVRFLHFDGAIDGRDILSVQGSQWSIQHLQWDGPEVKSCQLTQPLPASPVTVIPKDIESRPLHQFILEQPRKENGYRVRVYLYDAPAGKGMNKFDLYFIPRTPQELGLADPSRPP